MSSNMQRLGATLADRMKKTSAAAIPTTIELGTIGSNLSLTVDSLRAPIPKGDYMINSTLSGYATTSEAGAHDGHIDGDLMANGTGGSSGIGPGTSIAGAHSHGLPVLKSGDRVLVAWCGNEPVVVAVVVSS